MEVVGLTLRVAAWSVGFSLPVAVLVAWLLVHGRFPGRALLDAFMHLPLVLPSQGSLDGSCSYFSEFMAQSALGARATTTQPTPQSIRLLLQVS
jgi:ABC-type Fe3+ transport system permease subunit